MAPIRQLGLEDIFWSLLLISLPVIIWRRVSTIPQRRHPSMRSVAILVLGDIGRSPRMMYHAQSFAHIGFQTYLIGYGGSTPPPSLLETAKIRLVYLSEPPVIPRTLFILFAPLKVVYQVLSILYALLVTLPRSPEFILVQNPPSIPTLALVQFVAFLQGSKVIIDWHNLGYSILALKLGNAHVLVKVAKWFEKTFGRSAYAHLFVTKAMEDYLVKEWDLKGKKVVLHDRPPSHFHRTSPIETHELFVRFPPLVPSIDSFLPHLSYPQSTSRTELRVDPMTSVGTGIITSTPTPGLRTDRPALVVSSTSWTADEDFSILIEAMEEYEKKAEEGGGRLPKMLVIVTGKGPLRVRYMKEIIEREVQQGWKWVRCRTVWLEASDYPLLLGSADLGVSLHASSSALDLPMKVVDMFGCGLPVCALNFACLDELVQDGVNGRIFSNGSELAGLFAELLNGYPSSPELERLRAPPRGGWTSWEMNWERRVKPVVIT